MISATAPRVALPPGSVQSCSHCGEEFKPKRPGKARFCSDRCRAAHRREGGTAGVIKSVRELARGGFSIIVHFPSPPQLQAGSRCRLETE